MAWRGRFPGDYVATPQSIQRERERETALQRDPKAKTKKVTYGDLKGRWWTRDWDGKVNGAPKRLSLKKGFTRDTGRWPRVSGETVAG